MLTLTVVRLCFRQQEQTGTLKTMLFLPTGNRYGYKHKFCQSDPNFCQ